MKWLAACALVACNCSHETSAPTDYFGTTIEPPRELAKLRPGMTVQDAKELVPSLHPNPQSVHDELLIDSGADNITLETQIDGGAIAKLVVIMRGHDAKDVLTKAWGEPESTRDALGQHEVTWTSEKSGWKAKLDCLEANCHLEFVPYHALTAEYFGSHVVPPGDLAKLRVGMPIAEARTIAAGPVEVSAGIPTGYDGVREMVVVDDKLGTVRKILLNLVQYGERVIEEAWGAGQPATNLEGKEVTVWLDPATRWRATLVEALGYTHDLDFDMYLPVSQLLGDQPDQIEALPQPLLGRTADEVKAAYKEDVTAQGKDLVITLPPTEWEPTATRVSLDMVNGRVKTVVLSLPFKAHPAARDALLDLFGHKWGEPVKLDEDGKPVLRFRDADPRVEAREDTDRGSWRLELK
nr:hypothetical protein [Kofleriaceae bacterium]